MRVGSSELFGSLEVAQGAAPGTLAGDERLAEGLRSRHGRRQQQEGAKKGRGSKARAVGDQVSLSKAITEIEKQMKGAAKRLEFQEAAGLRDRIEELLAAQIYKS